MIVPVLALPPTMPSADQVTAVLLLPVTVAVNCCVALVLMTAEVGVTETTMSLPLVEANARPTTL